MKFVKRISYFFVIPVVFLILGIFLGVWGIHFFYPGQWQDLNENRLALPLTEEEMRPLGVAPADVVVDFEEGDSITVICGVWKDTVGVIQSINPGKQSVTINVELFGRETPVEIGFTEIKKM